MSTNPASLDEAAAAGARPSPAKSVASRIIDALKSAKELMALAAFFGAGLVWVVNYFATRDQLESLECFTKVNVRMLQANVNANLAEQGFRQARVELLERRTFIGKAKANGYSEEDIRSTESRIDELNSQLATFQGIVASEKKAAQRALTALTQNQCLLKEQRARLVSQIGDGQL